MATLTIIGADGVQLFAKSHTIEDTIEDTMIGECRASCEQLDLTF